MESHVRRKRLLFFALLGTAVSLFGLAAFLTAHLDGEGGDLTLLRFVVLCFGIGSAIGTWATAVTIASVHGKAWPLLITLATIVVAGLSFATACYYMPPVRP
jgi:hypothetical protein